MHVQVGSESVIAGMSERSDGSMVWWNRLPIDEKISANRNRYFRGLGIDPIRVVAGGVSHGTNVTVVGDAEAGIYIPNSDALATNTSNLFLSVTAADCMPVFFYDPVKKAIAIAHAGWKGLVAGILERTVGKLVEAYGSKSEDLSVAIGPHIGPCDYDVGEDVAVKFGEASVVRRDGRPFIDLACEAESRLRDSGVVRIEIDATCTFCNADRFYSARHDGAKPLEGALAFIGISYVS